MESVRDSSQPPPLLERFQPLAETLRHCTLLPSEAIAKESDGPPAKSLRSAEVPKVVYQLPFKTERMISFVYTGDADVSDAEEPIAALASGASVAAREQQVKLPVVRTGWLELERCACSALERTRPSLTSGCAAGCYSPRRGYAWR